MRISLFGIDDVLFGIRMLLRFHGGSFKQILSSSVVVMETGVSFCGWGFGFENVSDAVVSNYSKSELSAIIRIHSLAPAVF